jgi:cAMP-dependent protein kinase regulator
MEEIKVKAGDIVINQGDDGNCLYIVEKGELDCYKSFPNQNQQYDSDKHFQSNIGNNQGKQNNSYFSMNANSNQGSSSYLQNRSNKQQLIPVYLKTYTSGDAFGELALLYNTPRAATISAKTDAILWSLDRETFTHIVKASTQQKREKNKEFLKHVDILSNLGEDELLQIQDSIKPGLYHKGDYIIREGEMGDVFYILEEGPCVALKTIEPGKPPIEVKQYTLGEYFGERALIKGEPRYSSIVATSDTVIVLSLDRFSFNRLLGPIEDLLKRNIEKYKTYCVNEKESENEVNDCPSENQTHLENEIDSKLVEVEDHLKFPEELEKNIDTVIESHQQEQEPQPKHFEEVPEPTSHSPSPPEEMQLSQDDDNIIKEGEINEENNQQMVLQSMDLIEGESQEL